MMNDTLQEFCEISEELIGDLYLLNCVMAVDEDFFPECRGAVRKRVQDYIDQHIADLRTLSHALTC